MPNPLFNVLNKNNQNARPNMETALLTHIKEFKGNPIEILQNKINSGEISQDQYNQMRGMAENIVSKMMSVLPRR